MKKSLSAIILIVASGISWSVNSDTQQAPSKDDFIKGLKPVRQKPQTRGLALVPANTAEQPEQKQPRFDSEPNVLEPEQVIEQTPVKSTKTTPVATSLPAEVVSAPQISVNLTFDYNSSELTSATKVTLDNLGQAMQDEQLKPYNFIIEGHTDSKGGAAYNWELSLRRAAAVKRYLIESHQIDPQRTKVVGKGETEPAYPENPQAPGNRRVVIINSGIN
jgi:outer membrane protein OmpA-like peptidoglycan-associated protein